jgi:hypothetical protein
LGRLTILFVLLFAWPHGSVNAATIDPAAIERARGEVLTDEVQRELPDITEHSPATGSGSGARRSDGTIDTREAKAPIGFYSLGLFSQILEAVLYLGLIIGIVLLVFFIVAEFAAVNHDVKLPSEGPREPDGPDLAVIEKPLADAEELAARGEFREAIHTLLLRTLRELVRSTAVKVPPSLTSREILSRVPLHPDPRAALTELITAVEHTHFGDDEATATDYARCRDQFQVFAKSFRATAVRT